MEEHPAPTGITLDGDVLRRSVCKDLGFSTMDRETNIQRAISIAAWEIYHIGHPVIASFITPFESLRQEIRQRLPDVTLVWVDCPIEVCEQRDPKGLYKRVRNGEIKEFTGIDSPFEEPKDYDIRLRTDMLTVNECVNLLMGEYNQCP
jgi:adenylyl-sulfate kinase